MRSPLEVVASGILAERPAHFVSVSPSDLTLSDPARSRAIVPDTGPAKLTHADRSRASRFKVRQHMCASVNGVNGAGGSNLADLTHRADRRGKSFNAAK